MSALANSALTRIAPSAPGLQGRLAGIQVSCVRVRGRRGRHPFHQAACSYAIHVHEFAGFAHVRHQVCGDDSLRVRLRSRTSRRVRLVGRTHAFTCSVTDTPAPPPPMPPASPSAPPSGTPIPDDLPPIQVPRADSPTARAAQGPLGEGTADPMGCRGWYYDPNYAAWWASCNWVWYGAQTGTLLIDIYWYWDGFQPVIWFSTIDRPLGGVGVGPWLY